MTRQTRSTVQWDWAEQLIRPLEKIVERVAAYDPDDDTSDFEEMLLEPLSISGGESFTAEDHRGREILELLQNAQDAAGGLYEEESDPDVGTRGVYIGISDDGLVVANTGDTFDFSDPERRKSLRILGHSENSEETIGQFGVGLTSIRSMGEAYEVWTKASSRNGPLEPQDCWRVFCGPRTTLAAIASAVPEARGEGLGDEAYQRFRETAIDGSAVLDVSTDTSSLDSVPLSADQIPYFTYPVAMESWDQSLEKSSSDRAEAPLRDRAMDLLTYGEPSGPDLKSCPTGIQSLLSDVGSFTTAVFVDFEDADWRKLFEAITGTKPALPDQNPAQRLEEQAWFDNSDTDRVTPELLLNLGHIDRLVVERFSEGTDESSSLQSWEVFGRQRIEEADATDLPIDGQEIRRGSGAKEIAARKVAVQLETVSNHNHLDTTADMDTATYTFWDAEFTNPRTYADYDWYDPDTEEGDGDDTDIADKEAARQADQDIEISVLLQTASSDGNNELYAPHLYYPISGAEDQFPYCIHGDFVVQQNRQSLAGSGLEQNCVVAAEAARLVGHLSETLATAEELPREERAAIPWRLLPKPLDGNEAQTDWPSAAEIAAKSAGQVADNEPLRVLRAGIYHRLRDHDNIQVVSGDATQTSLTAAAEGTQNVLLHHEPTVLAGISSLYPLVNYADVSLDSTRVLQRADAAVEMSIPTRGTLEALLYWLVDERGPSGAVNGGTTSDHLDGDQDRLSPDLLGHVQNGVATNRVARLEQFMCGDDIDSNLGKQLVGPWWSVLQTWSESVGDWGDVGCAISEVPPETGQAILEATVILGEDDDTFPDGATFTAATEGPYLLPCDPFIQERESELSVPERTGSPVQLVRVESHETRGEHQRHVLRPQRRTTDEIVPPAETGFALYILSDTISPKSQEIIKDANWGTREYAGAADLYRTLLRDVRDGSAEVSVADLRFLIEVYNSIDFDSQTTALDAVEGGYHPREQVKKLANSTTAVDNLKPRVSARQVSIPTTLLDGDEAQPGYSVRFGPEFVRAWLGNHFDTVTEEGPPLEDVVEAGGDYLTHSPVRTEGPVATPPSAEDAEGLSEYSSAEIATQLGMLGVSVLPDVRTLLLRGDDVHPDRQTVSSWDPTTWNDADEGRLSELTEVLESAVGQAYLDLLVTPSFGPGESSDHTPNCTVKDYPQRADDTLNLELASYDVMLTSWLWLPPERVEEIDAPELATLLELYGDALSDSVLQTGWSCDYGKGNAQDIANFVPSLLNWQLRAVTDWDEVEWFHSPTIDGLWTDHDEWGLQFAVLEEDISGRRTAASAFPRIDLAASPVSEAVWRTLGVKKLEELNATEAAFRLNALIGGASVSPVEPRGAEGEMDATPTALELPGIESINAWQTLYGRLLSTIGAEISDRGDGMTLEKLQFLDRVPAQTSDGTWVGLLCDALDAAVYYDSTESDWENRLARLKADAETGDTTDVDGNVDAESWSPRYLLPRPLNRYVGEDEFEALWESTAATRKPAQYPEIERSKTTDVEGGALQNTLENPEIKYGILAAAPGKKARTEHRNQYETITETLRRLAHSETDSVESEMAWRVTPSDGENGLELDNVEKDSRYVVAYDDRVVDDPTEPVELADLFVALYGGGNKDSYKLALLGRDVEGKDSVRRELRATDIQELETDLRLAAALLDSSATIEPGMLTPPEGISLSDLREDIANCLEDGDPLSNSTKIALGESVAEKIEEMCDAGSTPFRDWAGQLVRTSNTRTDTLQSIPHTGVPDGSVLEDQLTALQRLEETLPAYRSTNRLPAFNELLPNGRPRQVAKALHDMVTGMQQISERSPSDKIEFSDLRAHGASLSWADRVFSSEDLTKRVDFDHLEDASTDFSSDDITWFHLAWWLENAEASPVRTLPADALVGAVADFLGDTPGEIRREIREMPRRSSSNHSHRRTGDSSSSDEDNETDTDTLLDQMASGSSWESSGDGVADGYSASTISSDGGGSSSGEGDDDGPISQTGDQPRVAELSVLTRSYEALYEAWDRTDLTLDTIQAQLTAMQWDDRNFWRPEDGWEEHDIFPLDELPEPDKLGQSEAEFPIEAFDITDEGIAGYDILDLTGWAVRQGDEGSKTSEDDELAPYRDPDTLTPVPVEVKSVDPDSPSFKFSLNQYQSAYQFVTSEDERCSVPYVIYLVQVSQEESDEVEQIYEVSPYGTIIITSPSDLHQLLPSELSPDDHGDIIDQLIRKTIYGGDLMISSKSSS